MSHESIIVKRYLSPFGELLLGDYQGRLCLCDWYYRTHRKRIDSRLQQGFNTVYEIGNTAVLEETIDQLEAYAIGKLKVFTLPIQWQGTPFQQEVWQHLMQVPYGTTESYLGLAKRMEKPLAVRAVAGANGANAISIIVPCHRIIGQDGKLVSYAGGVKVKKKLLMLEAEHSPNKQAGLFDELIY